VQIRPGSVEQMQGTLYYLYDAWVETPGAIEVIREKSEKGRILLTSPYPEGTEYHVREVA